MSKRPDVGQPEVAKSVELERPSFRTMPQRVAGHVVQIFLPVGHRPDSHTVEHYPNDAGEYALAHCPSPNASLMRSVSIFTNRSAEKPCSLLAISPSLSRIIVVGI